MKQLHDVPAPAKLNLFLHITGQRPDGYHLLQSVFMLIDWCDTLHFEKRSDGAISREDLTIALPADDLITRAARLLQRHTGCTEGVHIAVEKQIPAQAGMGGGSSDAATCLLALNQLWELKLGLPTLEKLGLQLGAWASKSPRFPCLRRSFGCSNPTQVSRLLKFLRTQSLNAPQSLL
jgi:4-diphosphocytidyl-2-C-methyl-D-erythritol kinase